MKKWIIAFYVVVILVILSGYASAIIAKRDFVYAVNYGKHSTGLTNMIDKIGTADRTVLISGGDYMITSAVSFPSNINIIVENGSRFVISTGVVLTVNAEFWAGDWETFTGDGTATGTAVHLYRFQSWGNETQYNIGPSILDLNTNSDLYVWATNLIDDLINTTIGNATSNWVTNFVDLAIGNVASNWANNTFVSNNWSLPSYGISAYRGNTARQQMPVAAQPAGGYVVTNFDSANGNATSEFNMATGRFVPTNAGWYAYFGGVESWTSNALHSSTGSAIQIWMRHPSMSAVIDSARTSVGGNVDPPNFAQVDNGGALVYMNGTTDWLELGFNNGLPNDQTNYTAYAYMQIYWFGR